MLDAFKKLTGNQLEATLCTLNLCIDRCPEPVWHAPVANLQFCQAVFHTLFYADYFLGRTSDKDAFQRQAFHRDHAGVFRDYEEFEDRAQQLTYDKPFIKRYMQHVRAKAAESIAAETAESLNGPSGFEWLAFQRGELYIYSIRHIQHHAAQLILRLRLNGPQDIPWFRSGWREM